MRTSAAPLLLSLLAVALLRATLAAQQEPPAAPAKPEPGIGKPVTQAEAEAWHARHPRLFFVAADVNDLRERIKRQPYTKIYGEFLARADKHLALAPEDLAGPEFQGRDKLPHVFERLALAGLLTGDRKYPRKAIQLMQALGQRAAPPTTEDGAGDLLLGLAMAYDWSYVLMSPQERSEVLAQMRPLAVALSQSLGADGGYGKVARRRGMAGHHVVAVAGGGLGLAALALRGEVSFLTSNLWQTTADECVHNYLRDAFASDGAGIEGFDLTGYALHGALPYLLARRHMDKVDLAEGTALASVASWYVYEWLSAGAMLPLGESAGGPGAEDALAAMFAAVPNDPVQAWFYDHTLGARGLESFGSGSAGFCSGDVAGFLWYPSAGAAEPGQPAPALAPTGFNPAARLPLGKQFPSRGLACVRSGWADPKGDVVVSLNCPSRIHFGRYQMDVNQFTLQAYGVGWAVDSGPGWQTQNGEQRMTPTAGSQGHNLMQIDGKDAARPFGQLLHFLDEKDWALAVGDGSTAFGLKTFRRYLAVGKRDGRARYVVVIDEIEPADLGEHTYLHFLHTAAENKVELAGQAARIAATNGAVGQFAVIAPRDGALFAGVFEPMAGAKHPRLETKHRRAGKFYYVAALVPRAAGDDSPVSIQPVFGGQGAVAFKVVVDGVEDKVCVLTADDGRAPEGFGREKHKIQLTNGAFAKSLLFDLTEPGHDVPQSSPPAP